MGVNINKVLVCDAVDKACIELLESNGISVILFILFIFSINLNLIFRYLLPYHFTSRNG